MSIISRVLNKFIGKKSDKDIKLIMPLVEQAKVEFSKLDRLTNDELRQETFNLRKKISDLIAADQQEIEDLKNKAEEDDLEVEVREKIYSDIDKTDKLIDEKIKAVLDEILPKAFAIIKETARRFTQNEFLTVSALEFDRNLAARKSSITIDGEKAIWSTTWLAGGNEVKWDMIHYDVQLIGGVVLHQGKISEMATGEGKTLVATLPIFLNALTGRGVHIVTVNEYLAKRDSEWMGTLFEFHGLVVDCIDKHEPNSDQRKKAYMADVTYGTNNEFGFDYLRDNMSLSITDLVQRKHIYAIVDEVDSVLIDDARTPLIISGPIPKGENQLFDELKPKVVDLVSAQQKLVTQLLADAKKLIKENKNEEGAILLLRAFKGLPKNKAIIKYLSEQGIKTLLYKTENTYLAENSKRMPEITDDLFFVIEEKNNSVEMTDRGIDLITGKSDDPKFFVLPDIGSEIAEIEKLYSTPEEKLEKKDQMLADYAVKSERIHTISQLLKAYSLFEKDVEYVVMDNKVKIVDEQTGRILDGRRYSDGLHQAIEAKENVKIEAATQTFATITLQNYFRMYKKLAGMTGTAETEAQEFWDIYKLDVVVIPTNVKVVRDDRQDFIFKTKREKYKAVIEEVNELIEKGRPVLVGTTSVEISELLCEMLKRRGIKHNVLNAKLHQREADIVAEAGKSRTVTIATNMAGRGTDIKLSTEVKKAGGLAIIGTERHESRRVDRQLRGRSGRQGDPGSSQFFVSLEDDLMRMFGSDRISRVMDRLGLKEGEVIQHSMITSSIERAQKKVEENNFGIRKRLLEYDDVMNSQREVVYKQRKHALYGERIDIDLANMMYDVCESIVNEHHGNTDFDDFNIHLIRNLSVDAPIKESEFLKLNPTDITEKIYDTVLDTFKRKVNHIATTANRVIEKIYDNHGTQYENVLVPVSDGARVFQILVNLKKAYETKAKEVVKAFEKQLILLTIDDAWKEHLREMDDLKQSVQNATYEQKDPLLIYKLESFDLFKTLVDRNNKSVVSALMKAHIPIDEPEEVKQAQAPKRTDFSKLRTQKNEYRGNQNETEDKTEQKAQPIRTEKKIGRNDPCPCGSGKKYKQCHGKNEV